MMQPEHFGHYLLVEPLGTGGMAEVFLARSVTARGEDKLLAIKRLLQDCCEDGHTIALLADEARITVQLSHPNIVQVFDFGIIEGMYYIAMEYVDGVDLRTFVEVDEPGRPPMSVDMALRIAISILDGLHFAHTQTDEAGQPLGIIHRDVTPHNVLISRDGLVKIADFGVARARISHHISQVGDIRGKFSYMPPEQACGGELDHRVDIFATGAILYELLCGRQPFRSAGGIQQLVLLNREVVKPSEVVPSLPRSLDDITLKALHVDRDKRFSDARSFADTLREQLDAYYGRYTTRTMLKLVDRVEGCLASLNRSPMAAETTGGVMRRSEFDVSAEYSLIGPSSNQTQRTARRKATGRSAQTDSVSGSASTSGEFCSSSLRTVVPLWSSHAHTDLMGIATEEQVMPGLFDVDTQTATGLKPLQPATDQAAADNAKTLLHLPAVAPRSKRIWIWRLAALLLAIGSITLAIIWGFLR